MPKTRPSRSEHLNRSSWLLWGVTFAVLLALTAAVPLLYVPMVRELEAQRDSQGALNAYYALIGLSGMVVVFVLNTILKQREINTMRGALEREEQEKMDVRTRLSELSALFQVSTTLNLHLRLDVILEIIVRRVVSTMRAQQSSIMIYNPESGQLETRASYGLESEFARNARKKLGEGIAGWVAERNEAVQLDGKPQHGPHSAHTKQDRNITSALSLPLRVGDRCIGVLNVNRINNPETFRDHHREMLQMFAEHVGAVVERAELMDRLGARNRELEAANQQLSETSRLKDVFLSTASHELKTPLSSVMAYAELLDDNEGKLNNDQRSQFLGRLRGEASRLMMLIDEILDLTRLETGKFNLRTAAVKVTEMVHGAVEVVRGQASRYGLDIREAFEGELPALTIDEVKMRQVVTHLLRNAMKFSPDHGVITVGAALEERAVIITVHDTGAAIRPDEATDIFELFGQGVREDSARGGGLGIGLHLAKRIAELHGGHVGVNSRPGEGSTFWVRLPIPGGKEVEAAEPVGARAVAA